MNLLKPLTPSLLALALAACAVGPDYQAPATEPAHGRRTADQGLGPQPLREHLVEAVRRPGAQPTGTGIAGRQP